jgi:hypothetical protein
MLSFDGPTRETCTVKRARTNTPLQALVLQNDPTYVEAARVLATRLLVRCSSDAGERVRLAFRCILGRSPDAKETVALVKLFDGQLAEYRNHPEAALALIRVGDSAAPVRSRPSAQDQQAVESLSADAGNKRAHAEQLSDPAELAAWTTVVSAIFNLDEAITKP